MSRASRRLRKINNKMEYRIDPVDFDTMTDIECYLESTSLTDMQRQEVRRDIIDMLIDGRRRGRTAKDIIGRDYRAFCDDIVSAIAPASFWLRTLGWMNSAFGFVSMMGWLLLIIGVIDGWRSGMLPYVPVRVGMLIAFAIYAVAAVGLVGYISRHSFDMVKTHRKFSSRDAVFLVVYVLALVSGTAMSTFVTVSFRMSAFTLAAIAIAVTALAAFLDYRVE